MIYKIWSKRCLELKKTLIYEDQSKERKEIGNEKRRKDLDSPSLRLMLENLFLLYRRKKRIMECQICHKHLHPRAWMQIEDGLCHLHRSCKRIKEKYKEDSAFKEARKKYAREYCASKRHQRSHILEGEAQLWKRRCII
jgi:hypothetical protein